MNFVTINKAIPVIYETYDITKLKLLFLTSAFSELPLLKKRKFIGFVSRKSVLESLPNTKPESLVSKKRVFPLVSKETDVFFVYTFFLENKSFDLLPAVDNEDAYAGCIERKSVYEQMLKLASFKECHLWIEIELQNTDNALAQLEAFLEKNGTKLLALIVKDIKNKTVEVSLHVDSENIPYLHNALIWNDYKVLFSSSVNQQSKDTFLKTKVEEFFRYLDV